MGKENEWMPGLKRLSFYRDPSPYRRAYEHFPKQ